MVYVFIFTFLCSMKNKKDYCRSVPNIDWHPRQPW